MYISKANFNRVRDVARRRCVTVHQAPTYSGKIPSYLICRETKRFSLAFFYFTDLLNCVGEIEIFKNV